ncbi:hypothetical protein LCGC14_3167750, partial [marine sediment metagenome]
GNVELIHMNGRVYDYNLGRFMSVDPFIQSPTNSQSINPYSYIMNNPLSGTDPTGYAAEIEKEKIKVSVTGSRIKRTVGEKATVTTTNDSGQVTNIATQTVLGSNVAVTSTNFENGAATSSTTAVMNGKSMTGISQTVADIGSPTQIATSGPEYSVSRAASGTDSDGNAYSFQVNRIVGVTANGAWGLIHNAQGSGDGYSAWAQAGAGKDLMNHPLALMTTSLFSGGGAWSAKAFNTIGMRLSMSNNPSIMQIGYLMKGFKEGYSSLSKSKMDSFRKEFRTFACGMIMACAAKFSPGKLPPQVPTNPPSVRNAVNYLHRWNQTNKVIKKQEIID